MLKHRLHTAVILATAAVAPLSLEARPWLNCFRSQSQISEPYYSAPSSNSAQVATAKPIDANQLNEGKASTQTSCQKKRFHFFSWGKKTQRATIIPAKKNTADSKETNFSIVQQQLLWTQSESATHRLQDDHTPRENTASADTLSVAPPPASTKKKSVRFDTHNTLGADTLSLTPPPAVKPEEETSSLAENKAPASPAPVNAPTNIPSPAPRPVTALFADAFALLEIAGADMNQATQAAPQAPLKVISEEPETKPGLKAQAAQLKAELASPSESSEETPRTESPEEVSEEDPIKQQFNSVLAQLSKDFEKGQQIAENPKN